tara:strand:+ start:2284 stop:2463 length:180 start_codon:yes stop_codon:yes gene_type:complete
MISPLDILILMLKFFGGAVLCIVMFKALWASTLMIQARKDAWRAGTHDYYGNLIDKDDT